MIQQTFNFILKLVFKYKSFFNFFLLLFYKKKQKKMIEFDDDDDTYAPLSPESFDNAFSKVPNENNKSKRKRKQYEAKKKPKQTDTNVFKEVEATEAPTDYLTMDEIPSLGEGCIIMEVFPKSLKMVCENFKICFSKDSAELESYFNKFSRSLFYLYKRFNKPCPNFQTITYTHVVMFMFSCKHLEEFSCTTDPFYVLSDVEKWKKWTRSYLNLMELLEKTDYTHISQYGIVMQKQLIHQPYRHFTRINTWGSNMTDEESFIELFGIIEENFSTSFRQRYNIYPQHNLDPYLEFLNFILKTIAIITLDREIVQSVCQYMDMLTFKANHVDFHLSYWRKRMNYYMPEFIRFEKPNDTKNLQGIMYLRGLYWIDINSNFFWDLLKVLFPNECYQTHLQLALRLLNSGKETPETIFIKKNYLRYSNILPFLNCKIHFDKNRNLVIQNYHMNDLISNECILDYEFDHVKFANCDNPLSLLNETRYSSEFSAFTLTIFGKNQECGKMSVYGCAQLIFLCCFISANIFRKQKTLQKYGIIKGMAGTGKSQFLKLITSVVSNLSRVINVAEEFTSASLNSNKACGQKLLLRYSHETGQIKDLSQFKGDVSEMSFQSAVRNLYTPCRQTGPNAEFCNAAYLSAGNKGLTYFDSDPWDLKEDFFRRFFPIRLGNCLGNRESHNTRTFYEHEKGFRLFSCEDAEFSKLRDGLLYLALDVAQYLQISKWNTNRILACCDSNIRHILEDQYLPLKVIRDSCVILDELYPEQYEVNSGGYNLKEILTSSNKIQDTDLTPLNMKKIVSSLKQLNFDIRYNNNSHLYYIYGLKLRSSCRSQEEEAFDRPHADMMHWDNNFDETNPQNHLPNGLKFHVDREYLPQFNKLLSFMYKSQFDSSMRLSDFESPIIDQNFSKNVLTEKILINRITSFYDEEIV
jgi:hypothetical protein